MKGIVVVPAKPVKRKRDRTQPANIFAPEDVRHECARCRTLQAENDRLTQENWQLKQACGYSIPADKETPQNPFKCGTCEARTIEIERLREALRECMKYLENPINPEAARVRMRAVRALLAKEAGQ